MNPYAILVLYYFVVAKLCCSYPFIISGHSLEASLVLPLSAPRKKILFASWLAAALTKTSNSVTIISLHWQYVVCRWLLLAMCLTAKWNWILLWNQRKQGTNGRSEYSQKIHISRTATLAKEGYQVAFSFFCWHPETLLRVPTEEQGQ